MLASKLRDDIQELIDMHGDQQVIFRDLFTHLDLEWSGDEYDRGKKLITIWISECRERGRIPASRGEE